MVVSFAQEPPKEENPAPTAAIPASAMVTEATPAPAIANQGTNPTGLEGEHRCRGRNPDGTNYQGNVSIRTKDGLILVEWNINGKKSYGTGLLQGTVLGVGLDDGVAVYQIVPQPQGTSLIGIWAVEGAKEACAETILIGEADQTEAKFPTPSLNGVYRAVSLKADGTREETPFSISGKGALKHVKLKDGTKAEGLQLGNGLTVITADGLEVFQLNKDQAGKPSLSGRSFDQTAIREIALIPYE
jgi:hypothetical protein